MPGTTYTRTGPTRDVIGRLGDFARYSVGELEQIQRRLKPKDATDVRALELLADTLGDARELAAYLNGYTTADD